MWSVQGLQRWWSGLLVFSLAATWFSETAAAAKDPRIEDKGPPPPNLPFEPLASPAECLPCKSIFSQLEEADDGGLVQHVEMVERG